MSFDATLGRATVDLEAPLGPLERDLAKAKRTVEGSLRKIGKSMVSLGKGLTAGVSLPIVALGVSAIGAASDVEEMRAKFDTVFGELKEDVRSFAETQAKALNRSKYDLEGYLATLQDTFVPMGFARDQAAELSKGLTSLAVDVASFNNQADETVIADFQSALVGNTETVRKYGIVITQAAIDQELLANGIAGGAKNATEAQKLLARYNLILKGTTDAQGDAARTSDSFANQMKGLRAALKELQVALGQELLPLATQLVQVATSVVNKLNEMDPSTRQMVIQIAGLAAAIGPALIGFGGIFSGASKLVKVFKLLKVGVVAVGGVLTGIVVGPIAIMIGIVGTLVGVWLAFRKEIGLIVKFVYEDIKEWLVDKFGGAVEVIGDQVDLVVGFWKEMLGILDDELEKSGIKEGAQRNIVEPTAAAAEEAAGWLQGTLKGALDAVAFSADEVKKKLGLVGEELPITEGEAGGAGAAPGPGAAAGPGAAPAGFQPVAIEQDPQAAAKAREEQLDAEREFLFERRQEWLRATDQDIQLIEERRDADIAALDEMQLSEEAFLQARTYIWSTAAEEIKEIEKARNDELKADLLDLQEEFRNTFENALGDFILDLQKGEFNFKKFVTTIISEVQKLAAQNLSKQITNAIFGPAGGTGGGGGAGGVGGLFGILGQLLGGSSGGGTTVSAASGVASSISGALSFLQGGGPVLPGNAYMVGESGRELFVPGQAGHMISNRDLNSGGSRSVVVNMTVNTPNADSFRASQSQVAAETAVTLRRADRRGN